MSDTRTQQWAICYDISLDKERSKIEKTLKGWGHRAQKSVFLVMTTRAGITTLQRELNAHKITTGSVLLLRLQGNNMQPIVIGAHWQHPDAGMAYIF
ncbi:MAG: CRISPR-associated endonuclease Cas2 [Gallionella sp.]